MFCEQGGDEAIVGPCGGSEKPIAPSWSDVEGGTGDELSRRCVEVVNLHLGAVFAKV